MEGAEGTQSMEGVETDYRLSHELVGHEADVCAQFNQKILGNTLENNFTIPIGAICLCFTRRPNDSHLFTRQVNSYLATKSRYARMGDS
jgi:hypothetical protein